MAVEHRQDGTDYAASQAHGLSPLWFAGLLTLILGCAPILPGLKLFAAQDDFLAFHQIAEYFAIVVSMLVFAVGWNTHDHSRAGNVSILSASFLGVALLDLGHTLSYTGMPSFITASSGEKGLAFWLGARMVAAAGLTAAAFRPWRPFSSRLARPLIMATVLAFTALVYWAAIAHLDALPHTFVPGQGLTPLKIAIELAVTALYAVAAVKFWHTRELRARDWLVAGLTVMAVGELNFVLYTAWTDVYNVLGHLYKIAAYALLYQGLFIDTVHDPYRRLARSQARLAESERRLRSRGEELEQANAELAAARDDLELRVDERTRSLQQEVEERLYAENSLREALVTLEMQQVELAHAKQMADQANQAKSDFLSSMSHELRTPLNAILGFAQLLDGARTPPLTEKQRSHAQAIIKGGEHLLQLINEILDLARIESGKLALSIEDADPLPILEDCLSLVRASAGRNRVTVGDWQMAEGLDAGVRADYTRLKQVLLNLMSNAVKYNRPGGRVELRVEPGAGGFVRFVVADTGPGIPVDQRAHLFEPFNRLGAEVTDIEGTGVGLTITKRLIEAMMGRIGFDTMVGQGTTFWVELPRYHMTTAAVAATDRSEAQPIRSAGDHRARKLLYVEDNPANIELMRELVACELPDFTLLLATTGEIAIEIAGKALPDVIVMDVNLPGITGIDAAARLRSDPATAGIPIIGLSANVTAGTIRKGMAAGFRTYLTKPLKLSEFLTAVAEACAADTAS